MNDFKILLQAVLDSNSIGQSDIGKIQKVIDKYHLNLTADLDKATILSEIKKIVPQLESELKKITGVDIQINDQALLKAFNQIEKQAESTAQKVNKIQLLSSTGNFAKQVSDATVEYNKLSTVTDDLKSDFAELQRLQTALSTSQADEELIRNYEQFNTTLEKVKNSMRVLHNEQNVLGIKTEINASQQAIDSLANSMLTFRDNNTKMTKDMKTRLNDMYKTLINGSNLSQAEVSELRTRFSQLKLEVRDAGRLGKSFGDSIKSGMASFATWLPASQLIMSGVNGVRNMLTSIKDLDTALVDLQKTTDATAQQLEDFYYASNETAKRLGATTEEVINAASAWSRLGYSIKDAQKMAENSSIFASISPEMDIDTATDGLVSMMKAFDIDAEESLDGIISKVNAIGNSFAVSNDMIVEAMKRSSSAMASANNSLEETIAMNTASTEITQNAEVTSNALRTMSMRVRGYDEETEEYIGGVEELTGKIADLTKTASSPTGISLFTDETKQTYKSTYQLLDEISKIYDDLTDKQQAELLEALAGKRSAQSVAALISNFDQARSAMDVMANSAGNAMQEMEIIYDSLDYKMNITQETAVGIAQNLFGREDMKLVVDTFNGFLGLLDKATEKLGLFGTIATGAGLFAGIKNVGISMLVAC